MSDLFIKASYGAKDKTLLKPVENGKLRVTSTNELYVDINDSRIHLGSIVTGNTEAQIKALSISAILPKIYISSDTSTLFWYDSTNAEWVVVGGDSVAHAATADRATSDEDGNNIKSTYMTKVEATAEHNTINENITALETAISKINSFEVKIAPTVADMPVPGKSNIMYFVPNDTIVGDTNVYDEYIWIVVDTETNGGHYENIGTTEANLGNYYTKNEIDAKVTTINGTISAMDTAYKAADTALAGDISDLADTHAADKIALQGGIDQNASDIDALESAVAAMDTAYKAADATLQDNIDSLSATVVANKALADATQADLDVLEADVATINRFKKKIVDELPSTNIDEYTIYFVPENGLEGENKRYGEYIHIAAHTIPAEEPGEEDVVIPAHFERLDSTVDFLNYYTKSEVNTIKNNLQSNITTNANNIAALTQTVTENETDIEAKHTAMDARVTAVEQAIGGGGSGSSLSSRMAAVELTLNGNEASGGSQKGLVQDVADNKAASDAAELALRNRATALEGVVGTPADYPSQLGTVTQRLADIDTSIGNNNTSGTVKGRITVNETNITALQTAVGNYPTAAGTDSIADRLDSIESAIGTGTATDLATRMSRAEGKVTVLETAMGTYPTGDNVKTVAQRLTALEAADVSLDGRVTTNEGDIDDIEANIGEYDLAEDGTIASRLTAIETGDAAMATRMTTAESDIDEIEANIGTYNRTQSGTIATRLTSIEGAATTLAGRVTTNEGDITTINGKLGAYDVADGTVAARLDAIEDAIGEGGEDSLATRVSALETGLDNLGDLVDANEEDIEEKLAALDQKVDDMDTAYKAADAALQDSIDALETAVGNINKFEIVVLEVGESLPAQGSLYTLYFVPEDPDVITGNVNKYDEYMWVEREVEDPDTHETSKVGSYEKVGVTEADFNNYYTKAEIDAKEDALEAADTALGVRIDGVISTHTTDKGILEAADAALANRATVLETAVGTYPTAAGTKTITTRLDDLEDAIGDSEGEGSIIDRLDTAEEDIDTLQAQMGEYPAAGDTVATRLENIETAATALEGRVDTAEDDIDAIEGNIGTYDVAQDGTIASRLTSIEGAATTLAGRVTTNEGNITTINNKLGEYDVADGTVADRLDTIEGNIGTYDVAQDGTVAERLDTAESDIDSIEANIGTYDVAEDGTIATRLDNLEDADVAFDGRITTNEGNIDTIQDQIGNYPDLEQEGTKTIAERLSDIEEAIGDGSEDSLASRMDAAEDDIDALEGRATDLETELASHDFKYAGSQTENGAADNVVETVSSANEERAVLLASHDNDAVEYASAITANPSTGAVTMNALKLGAATITFDTNTESLVVNF